MDTMTAAAMPGAFVVDLIPIRESSLLSDSLWRDSDPMNDSIVKHLPRWVPYTTFHQIGDFGRDLITRFVTRPFDHVERTLVCRILDCLTLYVYMTLAG